MVEQGSIFVSRGNDSVEVEAKDDKPTTGFADEHLDPIEVSMCKAGEQWDSRLDDGLLEGLMQPDVRIFAVADALHILILGEERITDASHQHHDDEKRNDRLDRHGCGY